MAPTSTACAVLEGSACASGALVPPSSPTPTGSSVVAASEQADGPTVTDEGGLSPAQIGGIFLGSFFGFMLVLLALLLCLRRQRGQHFTSRSTSPTHTAPRTLPSPSPPRRPKPSKNPYRGYNPNEDKALGKLETLQKEDPDATIVIKIPGFKAFERRPRVFEIPEDDDDDDEEPPPPPPPQRARWGR